MEDVLGHDELKALLIDAGLVEEKDLELAEERFRTSGGTFSQAILWYSLVSDEELGRLMADALGVPYTDLSQRSIPDDVLRIIPEIVAKRRRVIAFAADSEGLHVAMADPRDLELKDFLEKKSGVPVIVSYASERGLENALTLYRKGVSQAFDDLTIEALVGNKVHAASPPTTLRVPTPAAASAVACWCMCATSCTQATTCRACGGTPRSRRRCSK